MMFRPLLSLPSLALQTSAKALRLMATVNEIVAARLSSPSAPSPVPVPRPATPQPSPARATDTPAASEPRAEPRDIPALAALPAPAVVKAIDELSLTDLGDLYDHESAHRRRRTVLAAIDAAMAPPAGAASDDLLDDVRQPDELVYTTATPRR